MYMYTYRYITILLWREITMRPNYLFREHRINIIILFQCVCECMDIICNNNWHIISDGVKENWSIVKTRSIHFLFIF